MTREESPAKHQSSSAPPKCSRSPRNKAGSFRTASASPRPQQLLPSSPSSPSMTHTHKSSKSATGRRFPLPQNSSLATSPPSTPISNTRVVSHIAATTSNSTRTPSTTHTANSLAASPSGNPIIDDGYTLSKVYGSAL